MIRRAALALALSLAAAPEAAAQLPTIFPYGSPWHDVFYPKLFWTPREGLTGGAFLGIELPTQYGDDAAAPFRLRFALDLQASTSGSRYGRFEFWAPALLAGWRLHLVAGAEHWRRENYVGIGNASVRDADSAALADNYYRAFHVANSLRGDLQRRVVGGLRVLVGWHAEHALLDTLGTPSQLVRDLAANAGPRLGIGTNEVSWRFGLVFDTRDREAYPIGGVLLEALFAVADSDIAGDVSYRRATGSARVWLPLSERWALAARAAGEATSGDPPVGAYFRMEGSDRLVETLGGPDSHRGIARYRYLDADKLLGNLEVRYAVIPYGLRTVVFGFLDAGRVFPKGELALTTDQLHVGGGLGLLIQFLSENALLGGTLGAGPDGVIGHALWRWSF